MIFSGKPRGVKTNLPRFGNVRRSCLGDSLLIRSKNVKAFEAKTCVIGWKIEMRVVYGEKPTLLQPNVAILY